VESFRSTLEEVVDADLLVHVVDASSPEAERQIEAVRSVLRELGAGELPELLVANKLDVADPEALVALKGLGAVAVSAATGEGVDEFLERLAGRLRALSAVVELSVPYERGDVLAALHREGEVLVEVHDERATRVRARLPKGGVDRFREFLAS
jgi:GTP-binding protein HflX